MKKQYLLLGAAAYAMLMLTGCSPSDPGVQTAKVEDKAEAKLVLTTEEDKLSYAFGMDIGNSLKGLELEFNREALFAAIAGQLDNEPSLLKPEEGAAVKQGFFQKRTEKATKKRTESGKKNIADGDAFRAEYAKGANVKKTESGMLYEVLTEGKGAKPAATDKVTVHYQGTLIDGTEFDSSVKRGQPATFPLNGVIKGWTEGVQLMSVGSKYKFVLAPELAYGKNGAGQKIGPDSTLIFEVELISIEGK